MVFLYHKAKSPGHGRQWILDRSLPTEEIAIRGNVSGFRKELVYCDS